MRGWLNLKESIVDRIYNPCNACGFSSRHEVVFYDTEQNKENLKVMIIYEEPGGNPGDDDEFIVNYSPEKKANYHRRNFPSWLGRYYTYHLEIFRCLKRKGYVSKHLKYFETAMKEVYFTDALKCRVNNQKGNVRTCSNEHLIQEIDELPNVELIIACGTLALESLRSMCDIPPQAIAVLSRKPIKSFKCNPIQDFAHGDIYDFKFKNREWVKVIHFAHPSYIYRRKVKVITPSFRENVFLRKACEFVFNHI